MMKLENFPSVDVSGLDFSKLVDANEKLVAAVRDAAYVTVGFGVLAFQQAQVRRRELVHNIAERFGTSKAHVEELLGSVEAKLAKFDARVVAMETKLDSTVEKIEARLPDPAAAFVGQAHGLAKAARQQVRSLVRPSADPVGVATPSSAKTSAA